MALLARARMLGKGFILLDNLIVVFGFFMVFPLISLHFVDQLGWSAAAVGLGLGLRQFTQQGLGLFGGSLADRFGAKPLIVAGMLMRVAGFATMALADTPWQLWLSCLLSGLGGTLFDPPRSALVAKLTRPRERSRFYSLLLMQDSAGAVAGALFGSWLLQFDFRWVGLGGAIVFLAAAAANAWLLPSYRVATRRAPAWTAIRLVLGDHDFLKLVLTLSGYYLLSVQIMLLVPIAIKHLTGSAQAVGWMYGLETLLSLSLLYPLARIGERYFRLETRVLAGIALMSLSLACMAAVRQPLAAFIVLSLFFLGTIITEPARETLVASLARPDARASYMGASRLGLALGGGGGFLAGGWLYDFAQRQQQPGLPWLLLAGVGAVTFIALARQFGLAPPQTAKQAA